MDLHAIELRHDPMERARTRGRKGVRNPSTFYDCSPWLDPSGEDGSKQLGDRFLEITQLPVMVNGHLAIGDIQVAIVVNQDMR
jgi:hypothetical protein